MNEPGTPSPTQDPRILAALVEAGLLHQIALPPDLVDRLDHIAAAKQMKMEDLVKQVLTEYVKRCLK